MTRKEIHTHRLATYTTALALMPVDLDMLYTAKWFTIEWWSRLGLRIFGKANWLNCAHHLVPCGKFSGNYKKQLQHLNKWHRHLCTIWKLCPTLPTEMVAIRRSRGQHGTHQPLYEVMAVVHLMYSLQPENTDILQNNIKGYPSVTTLMVSYSAVANQLAQQRLYHHIQAVKHTTCLRTTHKHAKCQNTPTCYSWQ